jgi:hypothetical protein
VIRNDLGKYLSRKTGHFVVQTSKNWYEGCTQTIALTFAASGIDRELTLEYRDLAASCLVSPGGSPAPSSLTIDAGVTEIEISLQSLRVPDAQEGDDGEIVIKLGGATLSTLSGLRFYNRPTDDDVVYISPTTLYSGYLALLRNGSPYLQRSFNGGITWHNAWTPASPNELSNLEDDIRFREPDGCYEFVMPVSVEATVNYNIQRAVTLPLVPDIVTSPAGGHIHSIYSGQDFVFQLTPGERYAGMTPEVSTDRLNVPDSIGVVVTPNGDGSFEVRIRVVRQAVSISIQMTNSIEDADAVAKALRVWAADGQLYISSLHAGEAKVYTPTGALVRSISVEAGQTSRTPLTPGFYIVAFDDGSRFKVSGF